MTRVLAAALACGLLVGCGGGSASAPPDDPEANRLAEEGAATEAAREKAARPAKPGKGKSERTDRGED
jgi:hypothetical protein